MIRKRMLSLFVVLLGWLGCGALFQAQAANILIVSGTDSSSYGATSATHLQSDLSGSNTVTISTTVPADLSPYTTIYDVRITNEPVFSSDEQTQYLNFLNAASGNMIFLMGENVLFASRNAAINTFIASAGGGTIAAPTSSSSIAETLNTPFNTSPNALTSVTFAAVGVVTSHGTGTFICTEAGGTSGGGLYFAQGSLANAPTGGLVVVYDINFCYGAPSGYTAANEIAFRQNMEAIIAAGGTVAGPVTPTISLVSSQNSSILNNSVTFTATVSSGTTPTGTVTFLDGSTSLGTQTLDSGGVATLSTSALTAGTHTITARYNGSSSFSGVVSSAVTQVVQTALIVTTTTLSASTAIHTGQAETLTATVLGASGTPTGTVTFLDGTTTLGTGSLSNNTATFSTSSLALGTHSITASYGGDSSNAPSASAVTEVVVSAPAVAITAPTPITLTSGGSGTTQITLSGLGSVTAPVTFSVSGLPNGATCSFSNNSVDISTGAVTVDVTLTTTSTLRILGYFKGYAPTGGIGTGALLLCGFLVPVSRRRKGMKVFLSLLVLGMLGGMMACSSHSGSQGVTNASNTTAPGTYAVTITASAEGATSASTTLQLTIQ